MRHGVWIVLVVWWLGGLLAAGQAIQASMPTSPSRLAAQIAFLDRAIDDGAGARMQALFPEGEFFTVGLTAVAAGNTALGSGDPAVRADAIRRLDRAIGVLDRPEAVAKFGQIDALQHGTFHRGWLLLLRATRAQLDGGAAINLQPEADAIAAALAASPSGVVASYPGGWWPCDAVVAMAAVRRTHALAGRPTPQLGEWLRQLARLRDPATGLLPHRINADGAVVDGPRGSSQAIIHVFWPELSPTAVQDWRSFRRTFVTRAAGLLGVREYPAGTDGGGDVDSGPLILGVSLSASAVSLGAARANGDAELAAALDREAEFLGVPLQWQGRRRFAGGLMPAGDALVAWSRSVRPAPSGVFPPLPAVWGVVVVGVLASPVIVAPVLGVGLCRRARRNIR